MMMKFTVEDDLTCCECNFNKPVFRLISLERIPRKDRILAPICMATLLCEKCLKNALNDLHQSFGQCQVPLQKEETEGHFLMRQIGVLVIPISMTSEESQLLLDELQTNGLERVVN
jgi:hypothetical protein